MPLTSYDEVSAYGQMLAYVTRTRLMPPWKADPSYRHFANENVLTENEIKAIEEWVNSGLQKGTEQASSRLADNSSHCDDPPDLVISMEESFEQYGIYFDQYQVFVIPSQLHEGKYIRAIEFIPGNAEIVRRCQISIDTSAQFATLDAWGPPLRIL